MNELFNELITEIMLLGEAGKKPATNPAAKKKPAVKRKLRKGESEEFPGYFNISNIYYSNVSANGQVTHKNDGGKMVALTEPEKKAYRAKRSGKSPAKEPATQGYGKDFIGGQGRGITPPTPLLTPVQPKIDTQQTIGDLEARASNKSLGDEKRQVIEGLIKVMRSGNKKKIEDYIKDNGIIVGSTGRLKAGDIEKFIDAELSFKVFMALKNMGVTLTLKNNKPVDVDKLVAALSGGGEATGADRFKPQVIFGDATDTLDVQVTQTGIIVEGESIDTITPDEENRLVQERVEAARQKFGEEFTQEWEDSIEEYVRARVREQNANIEWLKKVKETGGGYNQFPKNDETPEAAAARMVTALSGLVDTHVTDPNNNARAKQALNDMVTHARVMSTAKTAVEKRAAVRAYNAALAEFQASAKGSELGTNMKYVGESLVALRSVAMGKTVLVPDSDSFPLADVITIGKNPITGENSIELFVVIVEEGESASVADSVKFDDGSAGVTHHKDNHSEFGPVGEISGEQVKKDLVAMGGVDRKNAIFTPDGKLSSAERKRIIGELEKYGDVAREYFGLPTDPNAEGYLDTEELYEFMSHGNAMTCVDGKPAHGPTLKAGDASRGSENPEQWAASSVVGFLHEAVHNRLVTQQYYKTSQISRSGLVIADGVRTLARAVYQPYKNLSSGSKKTPRVGKTPDSSMVSFSVPATSDKDLRDGNPCNREKQ
jgi:hypothetical protein